MNIHCEDCVHAQIDVHHTVRCYHTDGGEETPARLRPLNSYFDAYKFPNRNNDCELFEAGRGRMRFLGRFPQ